jgi:ComF family protein
VEPETSDHHGSEQPPGRLRIAARLAVSGLRMVSRASADLLTPPVCAACQKRIGALDALCALCWRDVTFIRPPFCDVLGRPLPYGPLESDPSAKIVSAAALADRPLYDRARAATLFGPVVKRLVHTFKYHDQHHARRLFGRWMADAGRDILAEADVLVPVPLHRWRLIARRFNQSAILTQEVARLTGLPIDAASLVRIKRTRQQAKLSATDRQTNVAGAFQVRPARLSHIAGKRVVLIDDVITTGATIDACARALQKAGANQVDVLAIALAPQR